MKYKPPVASSSWRKKGKGKKARLDLESFYYGMYCGSLAGESVSTCPKLDRIVSLPGKLKCYVSKMYICTNKHVIVIFRSIYFT